MKMKQIAVTMCIVASGCVVAAWAAEDLDQAQFAQITVQPTDQTLPVGGSTVLSVFAGNANGFQWYRNGVAITGQTNNTLLLQNIGTNDVGLYACAVLNGDQMVPTRAANVCVYTPLSGENRTILYATPVQSGGSSGTCPGSYAGYVSYTKTVSQGWGWAPTAGTTSHVAADGTSRVDTKIVYLGRSLDSDCNQTQVTVPDPTYSTKYRFTIYFPGDVPTNSYPIVLTGFDP
jgi:hypothetical protein